ncbi:hypothetical protein S40285_09049 [Stachybotrys chlorohalonatus IBT 40285]|uniref:Uncharacterized protein n=1 Tax=Stachybotrys chlorohalonatus (strain IBT 40285) TaxID=1283841 RepID=A0A084QY50_STAC4|nr:hypothetical protein S40285_09049 [Stachybotrys chlorohalonata IBT 40285]
MQKIKTILEARKAPVDSMNHEAVFDKEFNVLPGIIEALSQENEIQIIKVA